VVTMQSSIVWHKTRCSPDVTEEHVVVIFRIEELTIQETSMKLVAKSGDFLLGLLFNPEDVDCMFLRNVG
jgi:hypothetical protein